MYYDRFIMYVVYNVQVPSLSLAFSNESNALHVHTTNKRHTWPEAYVAENVL